jgi:TonB family protein
MTSTRRLAMLLGLGSLATILIVPATLHAQVPSSNAATEPSVQDATRDNASGVRKARNRDFDGAIADYTEAIRLDPTFADAFHNRGVARSAKGDFDAAIRDYSRAIELDPRRARTYFSRGVAFSRTRDYDRAIESFSKGLEISPNDANAYDDRALARSNKGDMDGAIADLNIAISLDPRNARAFNNRGFVRSRKGDSDGAILDYTEAIRLNGYYTRPFINRGLAREKKNDLAAAIDDFTQAIGLEPNNAGAYFERAQVRQLVGDTGAAELDFTRAATLDSKLTRPGMSPPASASINGAGDGADAQTASGTDDGWLRWNGVTNPRLVRQVKPEYTADAMKAGIQGSVLLECVVAADGTVSDARVLRPLDPGLDAEAVKAAKRWQFEPGKKDGKPVAVHVTIKVNFELREYPH